MSWETWNAVWNEKSLESIDLAGIERCLLLSNSEIILFWVLVAEAMLYRVMWEVKGGRL